MTTLRLSSDKLLLMLLRDQAQATAAAIGKACRMTPAEVRSRLVHLESLRLISSRQDTRTVPPGRAYAITREGLRRVQPAS